MTTSQNDSTATAKRSILDRPLAVGLIVGSLVVGGFGWANAAAPSNETPAPATSVTSSTLSNDLSGVAVSTSGASEVVGVGSASTKVGVVGK